MVKDKEGNPQEGAEISLEILNMAEFHRAITIVTGEDKKAGIRMGCKDIRIHAKKGTLFGDADCTLLLDDFSKADPLEYARFYQDEEGYAEYILCPRVYTEELTCYRKYISSYFTDSQKVKFRNDPTQILGWIEENITYEEELEYEALAATPVCCLKLLKASSLSRGILFVAICRTLGIAARLNPASLEAQYYKNGNFTEAKQDSKKIMITGVLKLFTKDLGKIKYFQNITIGRLQGDQFITLDYENITWNKSPMEFHLPKGVYRLLVSSRMPGGDQMLSQRCFALEAGEVKEITVQLKCAALKDQLVSYELNDFTLENKDGKRELLSKIIQDKTSILYFLEEGKEPTEHVLNELLERAGEITLLPTKIIFIVNHKSCLKNETLGLAVKKIPAVEIYFDDFSENVEAIARRMYVDPEKMPLLTIVQPNLTGIYASSGYNVGSVDLMMKLVSLGSTGN